MRCNILATENQQAIADLMTIEEIHKKLQQGYGDIVNVKFSELDYTRPDYSAVKDKMNDCKNKMQRAMSYQMFNVCQGGIDGTTPCLSRSDDKKM